VDPCSSSRRRPALSARWGELFATGGWPAFIDADHRAAAALLRIRSLCAAHELAVVDNEQVVAGTGA
jgi:hypothetical protein